VSDPTSDEILMAAYLAGNADAFRALFERHSGSVYGFLVRRLGDGALAEDLFQEAFLRVHRARASYDPARPFRAWLFAIVHNLLNDALRERARSPVAAPRDGGTARNPAPDVAAADGPEQLAAARESTDALSRALRALPPDEATVLILARIEGLSYEEIAAILGRTPAAAKQLAYRALRRVRAEMVAAGHGEPSP
jgi:RNA polymerase sigma factor (sigma-70 family)